MAKFVLIKLKVALSKATYLICQLAQIISNDNATRSIRVVAVLVEVRKLVKGIGYSQD